MKMTEKTKHRVLQLLKRIQQKELRPSVDSLEEIAGAFAMLGLTGMGPNQALIEISVVDGLVIQGIMALAQQLLEDEEIKKQLVDIKIATEEEKTSPKKTTGPDFSTIDSSLN